MNELNQIKGTDMTKPYTLEDLQREIDRMNRERKPDTDFERVFAFVVACGAPYQLTDEKGGWHRLEAGPSMNNAGRRLLDGKSFIFNPDGVLAGMGDQGGVQ